MARVSPIQTNFNAGQLSERLEGRVDLAKYANGCRVLKNFIPQVQGPAQKRSGTRFVIEAFQTTGIIPDFFNLAYRLIPFEFSTDDAYILMITEEVIWFFRNNGVVIAPIQTFVDADVNVTVNHIVTAPDSHFYVNEQGPFRLTTTGTLPAGLALATDYFIYKTVISTKTFVDADVNVAADIITFTAHGMQEDDGPFQLTTTGTLPAGLALATDYWVVGVLTNTVGLSLTQGGAAVDITAAAGGGTHTMTHQFVHDATRFGLSLTQGGPLKDITAAAGGGTHTLTPNGTVPHELKHTYIKDQVKDIQFTQSGDTLYLVHRSHPPRKLQRTGHTAWTIEDIDFIFQPFEPENIDQAITISVSATTGVGITLTGVGTDWVAATIGRFIKLRQHIPGNEKWAAAEAGVVIGDIKYFEGNVYKAASAGTTGNSPPTHRAGTITDGSVTWTFVHSGSGYVKVTAVASTTSLTADVVKELPATFVGAADFRWAESAWDAVNGFPRTVNFYEDRLFFAGTNLFPQTFWASRTGDFENHELTDEDESALIFTLSTDKVNVIEWISPGKVLAIGTAGGEFIARASSLEEALTPNNIRVVRHSNYGSRAAVRPLRVEQVVLFAQRSGRKLRELVFNFDTDSFIAPDLSVLADDLFKAATWKQRTSTNPLIIHPGQINEMAFQQEPNRTVWVLLNSGNLLSMTYDRNQQVIGWHEHQLGGRSSLSGDLLAKVESIAVIPHPDGDGDQLWMVVQRDQGVSTTSASHYHVEYMDKDWVDTTDIDDAVFVDGAVKYDPLIAAEATTLSGLDHLEGETVRVLGDGIDLGTFVVASGAITLPVPVNRATVGMAYDGILQTMRPEGGSREGTAQGKLKRITKFVVRLFQTGFGLQYGAEDDSLLEDVELPNDGTLKDGDTNALAWPKGYEQEGRILLKHGAPLPCTITAIMPQISVQDR